MKDLKMVCVKMSLESKIEYKLQCAVFTVKTVWLRKCLSKFSAQRKKLGRKTRGNELKMVCVQMSFENKIEYKLQCAVVTVKTVWLRECLSKFSGQRKNQDEKREETS